MKNSVGFFFLIVVCFFLYGCANNMSESTDIPTITVLVDSPSKVIEEYDDYLTYTQSNELPRNFVNYSAISHWGSFGHFLINPDALMYGIYDWYAYEIIDTSGMPICIDIKHTSSDDNSATANMITNVNLADMRTVNTSEVCVFHFAGLEYRYNKGNLYAIVWYENDLTFILSENLRNHPLDTSTVGQLLNIQGKTEKEIQSLVTGK